MIDLKELMRTTTEPLTAATLREALEAQQADDGRVEIVKPLNL